MSRKVIEVEYLGESVREGGDIGDIVTRCRSEREGQWKSERVREEKAVHMNEERHRQTDPWRTGCERSRKNSARWTFPKTGEMRAACPR